MTPSPSLQAAFQRTWLDTRPWAISALVLFLMPLLGFPLLLSLVFWAASLGLIVFVARTVLLDWADAEGLDAERAARHFSDDDTDFVPLEDLG